MKAITIIQPWATLIALGEKKFETRSWRRKYRGPLAIHAGLKVDRELCEKEPFRSVLAKHGYTADNLPTGAIVATCELSNCLKIDVFEGITSLYAGDSNHEWIEIDGNELMFGWYDNGRYAWELTNVQQLPESIPAKGMQGIWNWNK
ncbi:ASCH domain-containing protein [Paenibacillus tyrfis]|uniref:ASCH domain-containing protein n=1 Tax=Paenibacillus tyrfis TaxID=1501230 RepID=A0A081P4D4_9BACL|nr:ASCH domain-containing protein [Paenibacillus tyrfis]KEQ25557.1 hypothetical protein ET33_02215 [Paenibacillus tyrfis]